MVKRDLKIEAWQERSPIERRGNQDKRKKNNKKILVTSQDRRTGKERRPWTPIGSTDDLPAAIEKWGRVEASSRAIQASL